MDHKLAIHSASQALKESRKTFSGFAERLKLTQRILIYQTELLEIIAKKDERRITIIKRKKTAWQIHVGKTLKRGGSMKLAADTWKDRRK
ncbi:MAG: hypothetical protein A2031_08205 [Deltaproteobacteria bacterium RBG_19FT_COMBO_43_11]|nr:MAG: hypothetical protein A2031_08205 [Deltaproteobacteria bacterium RBG_19FT_COMBO_43_11]